MSDFDVVNYPTEIEVDATSKGLKTTLVTQLDKDNDVVTAHPHRCNLTVIDVQTTVGIGGGVANDTLLSGITIVKALTGTCVIAGFAGSLGTAQSITIPAGAVGEFNFDSAINEAGALTVTCSNAADDNNVLVKWRAA